jgi:hypothetical protein
MFPRPPSKPPHLARLSFPNSTYIRRNSARFSTASALGYNHQHLDPSPSHVLSSHPDQPGGQGGLTEGREAAGQAGETAGRLIAVGFDASLNVSEAYLAGEVEREEQQTRLQIQEEEEESIESLRERGREGWMLFDFAGEEGSNELRCVNYPLSGWEREAADVDCSSSSSRVLFPFLPVYVDRSKLATGSSSSLIPSPLPRLPLPQWELLRAQRKDGPSPSTSRRTR